MTAATAGTLLVLFLPFLLSLAGQGGMAKMLCLLTSVPALLLSVQEYAAVLPWVLGMIIAGGWCGKEFGSGGWPECPRHK